MATEFFTRETLSFLRGLVKHNDREWFEARREVYERSVKAPMHALIEAVNTAISEFAPEHVRPPAKAALRIYRDTRFSPDKRPYKRQISAWWGIRGMERTTGAGFYFHVGTTAAVVAAGVFTTTPQQLIAVRRGLAEDYALYRRAVAKIVGGKAQPAFTPSATEPLKRVPRGFASDHPAEDLLRATRWGVGLELPVEEALAPAFPQLLAAKFRRAAPLVLLLDAVLRGEHDTA